MLKSNLLKRHLNVFTFLFEWNISLTKSKWEASHLCHFLSAVCFPARPLSVLPLKALYPPDLVCHPHSKSLNFSIAAPHCALTHLNLLALTNCDIQHLPTKHHCHINFAPFYVTTVCFFGFFYFPSQAFLLLEWMIVRSHCLWALN